MIAVVVAGAVLIAAIGFAGSYAAVRALAERKGFGSFASVFPIGVDAGIVVLLALDLLLTWLRIPFPMLRQAAWLLTAATIAFNAAAAWPDPIGVGMHAVIPVLFVVAVEAARHAIGRLAAITADRHMEPVRLWRWVLSPLPTFKLWRRMMLWEIRKYDDVLKAEQRRLVYQARLRTKYGRGWRWKAPVEELLPLRIARVGVPLQETDPAKAPEVIGSDEVPHLESVASQPPQQVPDVPQLLLPRALGVGPGAPVGAGNRTSATSAEQEKADEPRGTELDVGGDGGGNREGQHVEGAVGLDDADRSVSSDSDLSMNPASKDGQEAAGRDGYGDADSASGGESGSPGAPAATPEQTEERADQGQREPDTLEEAGDSQTEGAHAEVIAGLTSNAAAVRYAMEVLGSTSTPAVVDWLKEQGLEVNRGQAHRITSAGTSKKDKRLTVVKRAS
ncbi:DUF2637 domain-containing protein [Streptomyces sp. NBC_01304]|uniref:DUF2637 domain-containing protein n=1 Tax=Streptomyces sp. NBC_01304 TaxID=2903818 RepID=UPI002E1306CA|nr:DUF2637 domain-containing protein [Streptomyces sp. NBC_01304]